MSCRAVSYTHLLSDFLTERIVFQLHLAPKKRVILLSLIHILNVKMSTTIEFGEMQEADGSTIEAPKIENPEKENAATINIPTGGTEENTKMAAVVFEEAR